MQTQADEDSCCNIWRDSLRTSLKAAYVVFKAFCASLFFTALNIAVGACLCATVPQSQIENFTLGLGVAFDMFTLKGHVSFCVSENKRELQRQQGVLMSLQLSVFLSMAVWIAMRLVPWATSDVRKLCKRCQKRWRLRREVSRVPPSVSAVSAAQTLPHNAGGGASHRGLQPQKKTLPEPYSTRSKSWFLNLSRWIYAENLHKAKLRSSNFRSVAHFCFLAVLVTLNSFIFCLAMPATVDDNGDLRDGETCGKNASSMIAVSGYLFFMTAFELFILFAGLCFVRFPPVDLIPSREEENLERRPGGGIALQRFPTSRPEISFHRSGVSQLSGSSILSDEENSDSGQMEGGPSASFSPGEVSAFYSACSAQRRATSRFPEEDDAPKEDGPGEAWGEGGVGVKPMREWEYSESRRRTCLIILTHCLCGDEAGKELIRNTLRAAVKVIPPGNILVADNARTLSPPDNEEEVVRQLGEDLGLDPKSGSKNGSFHYLYLPVGNKTIASFWALRYWLPRLEAESFTGSGRKDGQPFIDLALLIDDDVQLPERLLIPRERFLLDPTLGCIAYSIAALPPPGASFGGRLWVDLQGVEYMAAGMFRKLHAVAGGALGPHGAIALWRIDVLLEHVYPFHDSEFIGDDIQMGMRMWLSSVTLPDSSSSSSSPTRTQRNIEGSSEGCCGCCRRGKRKGKTKKRHFWLDYCVESCVDTETPSDFLILWKQRWLSWDLAAQRNASKALVFIVLSFWKGQWRLWLANLSLLAEAFVLLLEWSKWPILIYIIFSRSRLLALLLLTFLIVDWILLGLILLKNSKRGIRLPSLWAILVFPLYRQVDWRNLWVLPPGFEVRRPLALLEASKEPLLFEDAAAHAGIGFLILCAALEIGGRFSREDSGVTTSLAVCLAVLLVLLLWVLAPTFLTGYRKKHRLERLYDPLIRLSGFAVPSRLAALAATLRAHKKQKIIGGQRPDFAYSSVPSPPRPSLWRRFQFCVAALLPRCLFRLFFFDWSGHQETQRLWERTVDDAQVFKQEEIDSAELLRGFNKNTQKGTSPPPRAPTLQASFSLFFLFSGCSLISDFELVRVLRRKVADEMGEEDEEENQERDGGESPRQGGEGGGGGAGSPRGPPLAPSFFARRQTNNAGDPSPGGVSDSSPVYASAMSKSVRANRELRRVLEINRFGSRTDLGKTLRTIRGLRRSSLQSQRSKAATATEEVDAALANIKWNVDDEKAKDAPKFLERLKTTKSFDLKTKRGNSVSRDGRSEDVRTERSLQSDWEDREKRNEDVGSVQEEDGLDDEGQSEGDRKISEASPSVHSPPTSPNLRSAFKRGQTQTAGGESRRVVAIVDLRMSLDDLPMESEGDAGSPAGPGPLRAKGGGTTSESLESIKLEASGVSLKNRKFGDPRAPPVAGALALAVHVLCVIILFLLLPQPLILSASIEGAATDVNVGMTAALDGFLLLTACSVIPLVCQKVFFELPKDTVPLNSRFIHLVEERQKASHLPVPVTLSVNFSSPVPPGGIVGSSSAKHNTSFAKVNSSSVQPQASVSKAPADISIVVPDLTDERGLEGDTKKKEGTLDADAISTIKEKEREGSSPPVSAGKLSSRESSFVPLPSEASDRLGEEQEFLGQGLQCSEDFQKRLGCMETTGVVVLSVLAAVGVGICAFLSLRPMSAEERQMFEARLWAFALWYLVILPLLSAVAVASVLWTACRSAAFDPLLNAFPGLARFQSCGAQPCPESVWLEAFQGLQQGVSAEALAQGIGVAEGEIDVRTGEGGDVLQSPRASKSAFAILSESPIETEKTLRRLYGEGHWLSTDLPSWF
uniref:Uncharacterized protein n=1 Tax=Chromera velia CCMP2878 TaxID=1169474 RepID=A0A0G4HFA5_9ALVE|eukprot:Cvel_6636.t1-p1 / transcript=Cvel_6636.t1 / gene=Cvel_6636 / organism=Chromera_velia_CCMP2878 / gene_product=hypothetical protein / transcript_product=hypothetical protein / location=Cvel_scaffold329:496-10516(+) / protein_length=1810 / sequence_SO=supercontig / SO=protein_coding / is_pseudo=false